MKTLKKEAFHKFFCICRHAIDSSMNFSQVACNFAALLLILAFAAGCGSAGSSPAKGAGPTTVANPTKSASSLEGVDWTKMVTSTELGCNTPTGPGHGVEVDAKQFADVNGNGNAEAFVAAACVGSTESWPDRLEVFDGASDPAYPRRIATLLNYQDGTDGNRGYGLRVQSITVSGKQVTVVSKGWLPGECFACGDRLVTDTFTWNGKSFIRGARSVTKLS